MMREMNFSVDSYNWEDFYFAFDLREDGYLYAGKIANMSDLGCMLQGRLVNDYTSQNVIVRVHYSADNEKTNPIEAEWESWDIYKIED